MSRPREASCYVLGRDLPNAEGQKRGPRRFSRPVTQGEKDINPGTVMMTRIEDGDAVSLILAW
jgi:hypothetical protein